MHTHTQHLSKLNFIRFAQKRQNVNTTPKKNENAQMNFWLLHGEFFTFCFARFRIQ